MQFTSRPEVFGVFFRVNGTQRFNYIALQIKPFMTRISHPHWSSLPLPIYGTELSLVDGNRLVQRLWHFDSLASF